MKLTKIIVAVALLASSIEFAEAAPVTTAPVNAPVTLQLPPPPPPPRLPRFGRRRRYVRHTRHVRRRSTIHIRLPHPPPPPPRP